MRPLLTFALAAQLLTAQDRPPLLKFTSHARPNGLRLILAVDHARPVINLSVWYHVGSKDERAGRTGFAHLFEHLMFDGSKNVGLDEHGRIIAQCGGVNNAYTSFDQTVYWESFPPNYLDRVMWLEADRMASLVITNKAFEKEREVVKEERRLRFESSPYGLWFERMIAAVYQKYPYKHPPVGTMEDLNQATFADAQDFYETYYQPNNATIVIVGDFNPKEALAGVGKYFDGIPRGKKPIPRVHVEEPPQTALHELTEILPNAPLPAVVKVYHLPPISHPDGYALNIASRILTDGQSSRLYRKLVYEDQVAASTQSVASLLEGPSLFFVFGVVRPGKDIKAVEAGLESVIASMRQAPVTEEELGKAKAKAISDAVIGRETAQSKAEALGFAAVIRGDPELYNSEVENYSKVTAADVQRVCQKYLFPDNETKLRISEESRQASK